jgi:heat shock protein HslJ
MRYAVLGVVLAIVLTGCGGEPSGNPAGPEPDSLRGQAFTSTVITEQGKQHPLVDGTSIQLRFTDDGRLVANAGCNTMSGPVTLGANKVTTTDLSITEMGCDPQRHEQDQRLSSFLADAPSWRLEGENLVLRSANTELVLTQEKARPLVGTTWTADTLIQGEVAGSTPAGVAATLVFGGDEVTVTGLCNLRTLKYQATESTITFELGPLTRMACAPEIMTVENAAVALFDGETTYRIDTRNLTITKGDKGLRFTAAG